MTAKRIAFDQEAREAIRRGVKQLARAVKVTLGPRGRAVLLEKKWGAPIVSVDGVTVAKEIELKDPYENMGAQMVKEVASKTNDVAGDGTTTATVLAEAIFDEGLKNVTAGVNPIALKRGLDQGVGAVVWSPLAGGSLTGKVRRNQPPPAGSRAGQMDFVVSSKSEKLHQIVDVLDEIAREVGKSVPQVALNWVFRRPTVASVIFGARNEEQLRQNLGAVGWSLTPAQAARLAAASDSKSAYPYWHQRQFPQLMPPPV